MEKINIEVAYATPHQQLIIPLKLNANTSILEAIRLSNITNKFAELKPITLDDTLIVGIFGKKIDILSYKLQERDRIEIYRPLAKTPNQRRLERANKL
jgi:putative ubiquitin-RnfH superfamily antitoxin RatB of RatAB toxin-antitoxin module